MRYPDTVINPGGAQFLITISPELKSRLVAIVYEDRTTLRRIGIEALEDYVAKHDGTITDRQARKFTEIEQLHREEAQRLGVPFERFLARMLAHAKVEGNASLVATLEREMQNALQAPPAVQDGSHEPPEHGET
jgi:hypothetical protein